MKFKSLLLLLFLSSQIQLFAVDRIVQEMGPVGTFANIGDAIAASSDGDRIVIYDRLFDWVEDITIDKSLTVISASDTFRVRLDGNITVAPSAAGKEINIMRMDVSGRIEATAAAPGGARSRVSIVDSEIGSHIYFDYANFELVLAHCEARGEVTFGFGKVVGNEIYQDLYLNQAAGNQPSDEVVYIVGNKIFTNNVGISASTNHYYTSIQNNFVSGGGIGIQATALKSGSVNSNLILNNTVYTQAAIEVILSSANGVVVEVQNNALQRRLTFQNGRPLRISLTGTGNIVTVAYNRERDFNLSSIFSPGIVGLSTNTGSSVNFIDFSDGQTFGLGAVDSGNPEGHFFDHDLTRNDIGTGGGSYSIDNYFPWTTGSGPRVIFVGSPRIKLLGDPIDITAEGYDK